MKSKPGKYVGAAFTPEQTRARAMWQSAFKAELLLAEGLRISPDTRSRKAWYEWLDRRLDAVEKLRHEATALFSEVDASFTISTYE